MLRIWPEMVAAAQPGSKTDLSAAARALADQVAGWGRLAGRLGELADSREGGRMVELSFQQLQDLHSQVALTTINSHLPYCLTRKLPFIHTVRHQSADDTFFIRQT